MVTPSSAPALSMFGRGSASVRPNSFKFLEDGDESRQLSDVCSTDFAAVTVFSFGSDAYRLLRP